MDRNKLRKVKILYSKFKDNIGYFHGFFQYGDADEQIPMAVIELESGHVVDVETQNMQFETEDIQFETEDIQFEVGYKKNDI